MGREGQRVSAASRSRASTSGVVRRAVGERLVAKLGARLARPIRDGEIVENRERQVAKRAAVADARAGVEDAVRRQDENIAAACTLSPRSERLDHSRWCDGTKFGRCCRHAREGRRRSVPGQRLESKAERGRFAGSTEEALEAKHVRSRRRSSTTRALTAFVHEEEERVQRPA